MLYTNNQTDSHQDHDVMYPVVPDSVSATPTLSSDQTGKITVSSRVILTCTVNLDKSVVGSDLSLLMVDAQLSRDGITLALSGPTVTGTTFTYTIRLDLFGKKDSGNYTCTATVRPRSTSTYPSGRAVLYATIYI